MIAHLINKKNYFICSNCRMKQQEIEETCWFCGFMFSNYEEELIKYFREEQENEING